MNPKWDRADIRSVKDFSRGVEVRAAHSDSQAATLFRSEAAAWGGSRAGGVAGWVPRSHCWRLPWAWQHEYGCAILASTCLSSGIIEQVLWGDGRSVMPSEAEVAAFGANDCQFIALSTPSPPLSICFRRHMYLLSSHALVASIPLHVFG